MRSDLSAGLQIAQAVHAAIQFSLEWPALTVSWNAASNNVVVVGVPDEAALADIAARAVEDGIVRTIFREPDIGNEITAVALQPGVEAQRICANLPCAGKVKVQKDLTMV